jgi:hypothetical protein
MSSDSVVAYLVFALADGVMYFGLAWFLAKSFKRHKFKVVGFIFFVAPFVYALASVGSVFGALWMLIFTPFYGLIVMMLLHPALMLSYYALSFGSLLGVYFYHKRSWKSKSQLNKEI